MYKIYINLYKNYFQDLSKDYLFNKKQQSSCIAMLVSRGECKVCNAKSSYLIQEELTKEEREDLYVLEVTAHAMYSHLMEQQSGCCCILMIMIIAACSCILFS